MQNISFQPKIYFIFAPQNTAYKQAVNELDKYTAI